MVIVSAKQFKDGGSQQWLHKAASEDRDAIINGVRTNIQEHLDWLKEAKDVLQTGFSYSMTRKPANENILRFKKTVLRTICTSSLICFVQQPSPKRLQASPQQLKRANS